MYGKILERDDVLYNNMAMWRKEGVTASKISDQMKAAGRSDKQALSIFHRFKQYSDDMIRAGKWVN